MNQDQQKRLDIALVWRDKGAVSVQFDSSNANEHLVTAVQFHSDAVALTEQHTPTPQRG